MTTLQNLNTRFSIPGHLTFESGSGGLITAEINNTHAAATIFLLGGHVSAYQPHGAQPVLMMSAASYYEAGKALRGGIPICWPWFGVHPTTTTLPGHGVVRTQLWSVKGSNAEADGSTSLRLALSDNPETLQLWDASFELEIKVNVGKTLDVELISRNPGATPYGYVGGLHPYFLISDIGKIQVTGLESISYLDAVDNFKVKHENSSISFTGFTNRVYQNTPAKHYIVDPGLKRRIGISKSGSHTTVIWNPGAKMAVPFPDILPDDYLKFVCVEPVSAWRKEIAVHPGAEERMGMKIWVEPI